MSLLLTSPRTGLGLLQVGNFCVSELLRDPPQPVQPCQIYQAGLLGGQTSRGDHCFISHPPLFLLYQTVSVCNPNVCVCVCFYSGGWKFMKSNGNARAQAQYEKAVPPYYYRPQREDCK